MIETLWSLHSSYSFVRPLAALGLHWRSAAMASGGKIIGGAVSAVSFTSGQGFASPAGGVPAAAPAGDQSFDFSAVSIIQEPVRDSGADVLLVFAPGALTAAADYIPLCSEIQSSSECRIWIAIINPPNNIISTEITDGSFEGLLERVKSLGFRSGSLAIDNVFVAGHSWGAWTARTVALRRAQAFIQLGSCFHTNPDNLAQYPKPVLTINGELDGQLTLAATAKHAGEIFDVEADMGSFNTYGVKPVILVPGMNHAQFSHGIPNTARGDLEAEVPIEEARKIVGRLISAFVSVQLEGDESSGLAELEEAVTKTQGMCRSYWEAIDEQGKHVKNYQVDVARHEAISEKEIVVVQHDFEDNFVYSKPVLVQQQQPGSVKIFVNSYLNASGKYGLVKSLWIKMKSREAVYAALGGSNNGDDQDLRRVAARFNEQTYERALEMVPEIAKRKHLEKGRKLRFIDDLVIRDSAVNWIKSDVSLAAAEDGVVEVQSPVIISPVEGFSRRFAGMHYMKLLTVAGAMQWILTDCFRDS